MEASAARGAHCDFLASMSSLEISPKRGTASGADLCVAKLIDLLIAASKRFRHMMLLAFQSIFRRPGSVPLEKRDCRQR
jgi:hypothetical protein